MKILFARAHMLCHDVNSFTKGPNHIDVIMGASTGDIVWFEAYSQKYVRINKNVRYNYHYPPFQWLKTQAHRLLERHLHLPYHLYPLAARLRKPLPSLPHGRHSHRLRQGARRRRFHP